jgi:hypothetical protein
MGLALKQTDVVKAEEVNWGIQIPMVVNHDACASCCASCIEYVEDAVPVDQLPQLLGKVGHY